MPPSSHSTRRRRATARSTRERARSTSSIRTGCSARSSASPRNALRSKLTRRRMALRRPPASAPASRKTRAAPDARAELPAKRSQPVSNADIATVASDLGGHGVAVQRLLFVADAAVADVDELPPAVRGVLDAATEVHVLTPTLPGRLAWLTDDVDRCRHIADERLDTVLGHMRSIGVAASGRPRRGSVLTVIADAVADFTPDHILLALRTSEHANWQERRLVEHIEQRFDLLVTAYGVDERGRTTS